MESRKGFGELLKRLRGVKKLSQRHLGQASGLAHSYIAVLETGRRACGPMAATRLADALQLQGTERRSFLASAAAGMSRPATNLEAVGVERCLLEAITRAMMKNDHLAMRATLDDENNEFEIIEVRKPRRPAGASATADLEILLKNGQVIQLDITVHKRP